MQGLDRELELIFQPDVKLVRRLEKTQVVSLHEAKEAYDWLLNNWLVDVNGTEDGKAIIIALAPTMIERHLLAEFPAFFVSAAQRGSGKTTVINMISTALSGVMASAASWSFDEEAQGTTEFVSLMKEHFKMDEKCSREFRASEVTELIEDKGYGLGPSPAVPNEPDPSALK